MSFQAHLKHVSRHNVQTFRKSPISEISGSLGDLGTLLPLMIALSVTQSISLPSTLVFTGLGNLVSGALFGVPIPVQPMKAIAAVAIDQSFRIQETTAAGFTTSAVIVLLSITGLLNWLGRVVPVPIVKGIQVGAGLSLVISAGSSLLVPLRWTGPSWTDNHIWTLFAFLFLLFSTAYTRIHIPFALIITVIGVILAILTPNNPHEHFEWHVWNPHLYIPGLQDFKRAIPAAIGQVPLTTLNSILATSHLSKQLLPSEPAPSLSHLGISLSLTNFISTPFGGMPICHGSGGLAGQYRFGARSGASVILLGLVKLFLGLFAGNGVLWVFQRFPRSLLGIMVLGAGVELAKVAEGLNLDAADLQTDSHGEGRHFRVVEEAERKRRYSVMIVTVAGILAFRNDAVGFLAGMAWHWGLYTTDHWQSWRCEGSSWFSRHRRRSSREPLLSGE
jgi:MFS superfamily sulfate permease-like transporter